MNIDIDDVKDFIYLDTKNYISLDSLKIFYWAIIIIPFMMIVMGIAGESRFALSFVGVWSFLYWIFLLLLQSKYVKKTFELRFLVNGMIGLFISSLFWGFYTTFHITSDASALTFDYFLELILFYIGFTLLYTIVVVFGIRMGLFGKFKKKNNSILSFVTRISSIFLPSAGVFGMYTSRLLRAHGNFTIQVEIASICLILCIFLPGLAHINFIQYFYCKKYKITCDEDGDHTSSQLVPKPKIKKRRFKEFSLVLKMLICLSCTAASVLVLLLIIGILINL